MKILVPSDFSKASKNAALYAAKFAKKVKGELVLFNVVHFESPPMVQVLGFIEKEIETIGVSNASHECTLLINELKSKVKGVQISYKVIIGYPIADIIENYASKNEIDLIIMGTKGANGTELIFGSNAVSVINRSSIPVIIVPEHSRFNNLKHIVCASDMHTIQSEMQKIVSFAKLLDASINILHVQPSNSEKKIDTSTIESDLIKKYKYKKISFHLAHDDEILNGINEYVADVNADILVMYTHEMGFFERFFKLSFSREKALNSLVPLLTFKK